MTQPPMKPLPREQLPEAPATFKWSELNGEWVLTSLGCGWDDDEDWSLSELEKFASFIPRVRIANGLAPQAEGERGELAAYTEYFDAVEHSRECAGQHCFEMLHNGKVRDETAAASEAANERIRVAKERIRSLRESLAPNPPQPAPVAHSKSEYKRLEAQGADVEEPVEHDLKCWPQYFKSILDGSKPFEYRYNDRNYRNGDILHLREWDNVLQAYTGRDCKRLITYVLHLSETIKPDREFEQVVLGLATIEPPLEPSVRGLPTDVGILRIKLLAFFFKKPPTHVDDAYIKNIEEYADELLAALDLGGGG